MPKKPPNVSGSSRVRSVSRVTTPNVEEPRGGESEALREAAEPAALDEPRDTDRPAAAALDVAAGSGCHRLVHVHPGGPRSDRDCGLRLYPPLASLRHERVVELDLVHPARPDEERVGRVRRALVAVSTALHDQAHAAIAREVHGRDDVGGLRGRNRVLARARRPRVEPARGLGQRGLVADLVGVLEVPEDLRARLAEGIRAAGLERRLDLDQAAVDLAAEGLPGLVGRPVGIAGSDPAGRGGSDVARRRRAAGAGERQERRRGSGLQEVAPSHRFRAR